MTAKIYGIPLSHPSHASRLQAELGGVDHEMAWLLPGLHPAQLRARGFRGDTVPAMKLGGRRYQSSLEISRALHDLAPGRGLFPADAALRAEVEAAEAWGERDYQPMPRLIFRWMASHSAAVRRQLAEESGLPLPRVAAFTNAPVARYFARKIGADDDRIRRAMTELPGMLDHVDELIADGTLGGDVINAADCQIGATTRVLLLFEDTADAVRGRPAAQHALRLFPEWPTRGYPSVIPDSLRE